MVGVRGVVAVVEEPFVGGVSSTRFEDAEDFRVDARKRGSVAGCLDRVNAIEGVVREWHFHEIAFHKRDVFGKTSFSSIVPSTLDPAKLVSDKREWWEYW